MQNFWEKWALSKGSNPPSECLPGCFCWRRADRDKDPENLLVMLQTWQNGNVANQKPYDGDFEKAMASIKVKTLVMPAKTDLYFPWVLSSPRL